MLNWLRYIRLVRQIDGLCFKKKTWIIPKLFGKPSYAGNPPKKAFFTAPIFFCYGRPGPLRVAMHEIRHKVQFHHPEIQLLTLKDALDVEKLCLVDKGKKVDLLEIDAQIVEQIGVSLFSSNQTSAFLELMLGKAKPSKRES